MVSIITLVSRVSMILMLGIYAFTCFTTLVTDYFGIDQKILYGIKTILTYFILINGSLVLYLNTSDDRILFLAIGQLLLFIIINYIFTTFFNPSNAGLINNICLFLSISFIELERIEIGKALRQFIYSIISFIIALVIVFLLLKLDSIKRLWILYALLGIVSLLIVTRLGTTEYGAKLSIRIGSISVQPAEFVKLTLVFFIAAVLYKNSELKNVALVTVISAIHVLILVASKDLGGALIFLTAYIVMLFIATSNYLYLIITVSGSAFAGFLALKLFSHIQTRFLAWKDPLSVVDDQGYQISQSLFAIGSGGWLGTGLYQGSPTKIPVVSKDFIFAAVSEEFGGFFALCLMLVVISTFLDIFSVAVKINDRFFRLIVAGFGTVYATQSLLNIGGVIKFIPSTGVTLPFISYGGSSLLSSIIMFSIIITTYDLAGMRTDDFFLQKSKN
ncbi:MAG: FtsW/RodA/SpoVE family cell cycle protein, partial [Pseudobutyrivibrio sp.]|nr:FtsW/RodA/SpoVE family cell cycle protein [Pseudobutyrivibrio sp.]